MPSVYLQSADLPTYGVPAATANQVIQASAVLDAYLKRPEGLVWVPDSQGSPCYMAALNPSLALTLTGAIAPGQNVQATLTGAASLLQPGDVVILDRAAPSLVEACVVTAASAPGGGSSITFQSVINAHSINATVEVGLVIDEKRYMPASRPLTTVSRTPVMRVISGVGRYGYGRRGDSADYNMEQFNLLAAVSRFGGPPVWEVFQPGYPAGWDAQTGQVWVPAGIMLAYYSEVKLRYIAGFQSSNIPSIVKQACATILQAQLATPRMGQAKSIKAGDTSIVSFAASVLDEDTKQALEPFASRAFV